MKKYLQTLLIVSFIGVFLTPAQAQYYEQSAGIRLGGSYGLTYKKFFNEIDAIEFLFGGREEGIHLTITYQFNKPLNLSRNETFFLYYGVGGHTGFEKYPTKTLINSQAPESEFIYENKSHFTMGVDAIVGLEFRLLTAPITIGLDMKPYFSFIGFRYTRTDFWDTSLSVKYVF
jgi:hypothetical protein